LQLHQLKSVSGDNPIDEWRLSGIAALAISTSSGVSLAGEPTERDKRRALPESIVEGTHMGAEATPRAGRIHAAPGVTKRDC
jgi:hypothetical protein